MIPFNVSQKTTVLIILATVIALGAFFRFYRLGDQSYWIDEGFTLMQARAITKHGYPLLDSGFVEKKDLLLPYLLAGPVRLFPLDSEAVFRTIPAVFGTASILVMFLLGRRLWGNGVGLLSAVFLALSYWHIAWSRQVRGYELLIFFTLLAFLFMISARRRDPSRLHAAAVASAFFAALSKSFGILLFPSILLVALGAKKRFAIVAIASIAIAFLLLQPSIVRNALSSDHPNYILHYVFDYLWPSFGLFLPLAIAGATLAIARDRANRSSHIALVSFFAVNLIVLGSFLYVFEKRYLLAVTPLLFLYSAYFLRKVTSSCQYAKTALASAVALLVFADALLFHSIAIVPRSHYALESYTPQPDFRTAHLFLKNTMAPGDAFLTPYPYMGILYGVQARYAIPLSYTGRIDESSVREGKEYVTGVRSIEHTGDIDGVDRIDRLRSQRSVFVLVDTLSEKRIQEDTLRVIRESGAPIFEESFLGLPDQTIRVYELPQKVKPPWVRGL